MLLDPSHGAELHPGVIVNGAPAPPAGLDEGTPDDEALDEVSDAEKMPVVEGASSFTLVTPLPTGIASPGSTTSVIGEELPDVRVDPD